MKTDTRNTILFWGMVILIAATVIIAILTIGR